MKGSSKIDRGFNVFFQMTDEEEADPKRKWDHDKREASALQTRSVWYDVYSKERHLGGKPVVNYDVTEHVPLFARGGTIIPAKFRQRASASLARLPCAHATRRTMVMQT